MNEKGSSGRERLRELSVGGEDTAALRMEISVSGGIEGERVMLDAEVSGNGHMAGRFDNQLTDRAGSFDGQMSDDQLREVIGVVASDSFARQPESQLFPPDTIVGSVRITLGGETVGTFLGAVDSEQVAGIRDESEPTSRLLAIIRDAAERMVDDRDSSQTDGSGEKPVAD